MYNVCKNLNYSNSINILLEEIIKSNKFQEESHLSKNPLHRFLFSLVTSFLSFYSFFPCEADTIMLLLNKKPGK